MNSINEFTYYSRKIYRLLDKHRAERNGTIRISLTLEQIIDHLRIDAAGVEVSPAEMEKSIRESLRALVSTGWVQSDFYFIQKFTPSPPTRFWSRNPASYERACKEEAR
jgi:hypothetical protein